MQLPDPLHLPASPLHGVPPCNAIDWFRPLQEQMMHPPGSKQLTPQFGEQKV